MTDNLAAGKSPIFSCEKCNYTCGKQSDWNRHVLTRKHLQYLQKGREHICECGKVYKHRQSLFSHKKKCDFDLPSKENEIAMKMIEPKTEPPQSQPAVTMVTNDMIVNLIEQNQELQKQLMELSKQARIINHTTNNTMNNQFNLNVFLNEDCKDALNIAQFIDSIKLTVNDLQQTGKLGYTQGIARIFIQALKELDVNMRPLHCTDIKREVVYIKDKDTWEKENSDKTKLRQVLKQVVRKNLRMLPVWQKENPDFRYVNTPENDQFIQISLSSLGPETSEEQEKQDDKIIRNVLKEVVIDKGSRSLENVKN